MPSIFNDRRNGRTGAIEWVFITDELQTVFENPSIPGQYIIQLYEVPKHLPPAIGSVLTVIDNDSPYDQWTELNYDVNPSPGEYSLMDENYWQKAQIEFNVLDNGKTFKISYTGGGSPTDLGALRNIMAQELLIGNWDIGGDLDVAGDLAIGWGGSATPMAGYMVDGTPFYLKQVIAIMYTGSQYADVAHGILNAETNNRVFNVRCRLWGSGGIYGGEGAESGSSDFKMGRWLIDDTKLRIYVKSPNPAPPSDITHYCTIWYK